MGKMVFAFARVMFMLWIITACLAGLIFDKEVIYAIALVCTVYCFVVSEVRISDIEKRLNKYKKAYEKLSKKYNEE